jgi:NAD(P)-dependent dehydrogenase (short-subunit alcohol dehydrogenase family)
MTHGLKDNVAVVTGGGSGGIGRTIALALAAEGTKVVVNDVGRDIGGMSIADNVVEEIVKNGGTAVANYDSVATLQGGENIIGTAISNFGRVDILVNCAGIDWRGPTLDMTGEEWDKVINVNLKGPFNCTKAAGRDMIKRKSGRIINFSSRAAYFGVNITAYSSAKAGILGFTSSLASEFKEYGITVNAILPSARTKLTSGPHPAGFKANTGDLPPSLFNEPDYIAPIVVYLCTADAHGITGRFIYASGGDICIYAQPLRLSGGAHMFIRKMDKWTVDELSQVIPQLLGLE